MATRTRVVATLKVARLVAAVAMLFVAVAGAFGYDMGVQKMMAAAGGGLGLVLAGVVKASYFT